MEQIIRKDGKIYYGSTECDNADHAYRLFRSDYHESLGRVSSLRLDRFGQRKERIHGFGFCLSGQASLAGQFPESPKTGYRILGIVGVSYCRVVGGWDMPPFVTDENWEDWLFWAFRKGTKALQLIGRKHKTKNKSYGRKKSK